MVSTPIPFGPARAAFTPSERRNAAAESASPAAPSRSKPRECGRGFGDRDFALRLTHRARQEQPRASDLQRHLEARERLQRSLQVRQRPVALRRRHEDATERPLAAGDDHIAAKARAELSEPPGPRAGLPDLALLDLDLHQQLEQRGALQAVLANLARAAAEDRRGDGELAAGQVDRAERIAGGDVVLEAVEQPRRLLDPALREAQLRELRQHLGVKTGLGGLRHLLERGAKLSLRLDPSAGREENAAVVQAAEDVDVGRTVAAVELVGGANPPRGPR